MGILKKWWFWVLAIPVTILIIIPFCMGIIQGITEVVSRPSSETTNNIEQSNTSQNQNIDTINYKKTNNTIEQQNIEQPNIENQEQNTLEDNLKKALIKYTFDSIQNENGVLTLKASTTGNAQYSIAEDVEYEYIHRLAPVVYKDDSIQKFIFKVTITDTNNEDFKYTYGCSLAKEIYNKYDWATVLDTNIYKIFINEGEIYSD